MESLESIEQTLERIDQKLGRILDSSWWQPRVHEHLATFLAPDFDAITAVLAGEDAALMAALDCGGVSFADWDDICDIDVVGIATPRGQTEAAHLSISANVELRSEDIHRAHRGAKVMRAAGIPTVAMAIGHRASAEAMEAAGLSGVVVDLYPNWPLPH